MDLWARAFVQVFERQYAIANCMQRMKNQWQRNGNMKEKGKKLKFNLKYAAIIGIQQCLPITMDSELIIAEELWTGTWYVWTWLIWLLELTYRWHFLYHLPTGSTIRYWHKVKTWLGQMFWQIYQKLMLSGFLRCGNLCLIHYWKFFWPHAALRHQTEKVQKFNMSFHDSVKKIFFKTSK